MSKNGFKYLYKTKRTSGSRFEISTVPIEDLNPIIAISKNSKLGMSHLMIEGNYQDGLFRNNLILIDSQLPEMLLALQLLNKGRVENLEVACKILNKNNPLKYSQLAVRNFYEHKLKRLLLDTLFGMSPNSVWSGSYETQETFIKVKTFKKTEYYAVYNQKLLERYLLLKTNIKYDGGWLSIFHN